MALAVRFVAIQIVAVLHIAIAWTAHMFAPPATRAGLHSANFAVFTGVVRLAAVARIALLFVAVCPAHARYAWIQRTNWHAIVTHVPRLTFARRSIPFADAGAVLEARFIAYGRRFASIAYILTIRWTIQRRLWPTHTDIIHAPFVVRKFFEMPKRAVRVAKNNFAHVQSLDLLCHWKTAFTLSIICREYDVRAEPFDLDAMPSAVCQIVAVQPHLLPIVDVMQNALS